MLGRLVRRAAVQSLDAIVTRGKESGRSPVRVMASAIDQARSVVGLDAVNRDAPLPTWSEGHPDRPMWGSDKVKLEKFQIDKGIIKPKAEEAEVEDAAPSVDAPVKVFYKRGCPYARAALDLLREREIPFEEVDIKGDEATLGWLKIVTGSRTTPQIFLRGESVGGYDELRELDLSGELRERASSEEHTAAEAELAARRAEADAELAMERADAARKAADEAKAGRKPKKVSLAVVGKERSPFEDLLELGDAISDEVLEGDALVARVNEVLDECRPMVQADGGDIELLDVQGNVVHLQLTGNCVGCPSSQATLRQGIERRLKSRIPQIDGIASPQLDG
ncbi:MAG: NifU family protein [Nannocystales bacterium]